MPRAKQQHVNRDQRLKAMAHPLRREIMTLLIAGGAASPSSLARQLGAKIADVTYHTKRLVALDCAELIDERIVSGAVVHTYRATDRPIILFDEWEELEEVEAQSLLSEFKQVQVDDFIAAMRGGSLGPQEPNFFLTRTPMQLDDEGLERCLEMYEALRLELIEQERRSAERGGERTWVSSALSLHRMPPPGEH